MLHHNPKTFGLIMTLPVLFISQNPASLSQLETEEKMPSAEVQPVIVIDSESPQPTLQSESSQSEKQGKTKGREYCDGIGVC